MSVRIWFFITHLFFPKLPENLTFVIHCQQGHRDNVRIPARPQQVGGGIFRHTPVAVWVTETIHDGLSLDPFGSVTYFQVYQSSREAWAERRWSRPAEAAVPYVKVSYCLMSEQEYVGPRRGCSSAHCFPALAELPHSSLQTPRPGWFLRHAETVSASNSPVKIICGCMRRTASAQPTCGDENGRSIVGRPGWRKGDSSFKPKLVLLQ
jgi:hypothetical protein